MVAVPPKLPTSESGKLIAVWVELKLHWKLVVCGEEESHFIAPSFSTPVLSALKVMVLSFIQAGTPPGSASSMVPLPSTSIPIVSIFHAPEVSSVSLLFALFELELFLLQLFSTIIPQMKEHRIRNGFIYTFF